jgi:hypothetical protein
MFFLSSAVTVVEARGLDGHVHPVRALMKVWDRREDGSRWVACGRFRVRAA